MRRFGLGVGRKSDGEVELGQAEGKAEGTGSVGTGGVDVGGKASQVQIDAVITDVTIIDESANPGCDEASVLVDSY